MATLFQGDPNVSTSSDTQTTQAPQWLTDAIYNQVSLAQNVAALPYQPYEGQRVAARDPLQQAAYAAAQGGAGAWKPALDYATQGFKDLSGKSAAAAADPYLQGAAGVNPLAAAQGYLGQQAAALGGINYGAGLGAAAPYAGQATSALGGINYGAAAQALNPYVQQALASSGLQAANPYLQQASQSSASTVQDYLNPYTDAVAKRIAELGARNLSEQLLPNVSDAFVKAGQFGGTRMGEFGSRALRDTQEAILAEQNKALQAGYGQALQAAGTDLSRLGQLGATAGQLGTAQQQAALEGGKAIAGALSTAAGQQVQGAGIYGQLASALGQLGQSGVQSQLTGAGQLGQMGQTAGQLASAGQQNLTNIGQLAGQLSGADLTRQQGALTAIANIGQLGQTLNTADIANLANQGAAAQSYEQALLNVPYEQYVAEQAYPRSTLDWLAGQIRGTASAAPTTSSTSSTSTGRTYSPSPASTYASYLAIAKALGL